MEREAICNIVANALIRFTKDGDKGAEGWNSCIRTLAERINERNTMASKPTTPIIDPLEQRIAEVLTELVRDVIADCAQSAYESAKATGATPDQIRTAVLLAFPVKQETIWCDHIKSAGGRWVAVDRIVRLDAGLTGIPEHWGFCPVAGCGKPRPEVKL